MLRYGGTITFNTVIVYLAYNADKILVGRFWGAEALGVYGRAYQLINLPTDNLNATVSNVAFPALCRIQNDSARLRRYFLRGYGLFNALVLPITVGCAMFPEDIVRVFLGPRWHDAAPIFRLLAPTMLVFAVVNPLGWLLMATGRTGRSLKIAFVIAPAVILGYSIGLPWGPQGVAIGFSGAMLLLAVPVVVWSMHGMPMTTRDIVKEVRRPLISIAAGAAAALAAGRYILAVEPALFRLVVETSILFGVYLFVLLFVMNQKPAYLTLLREANLWPVRAKQTEEAAA